jgi:serine/threonine protein kinase
MEYYPHGSLHKVLTATYPRQDGSFGTYHRNLPISEPALWSIFDNLVDACLLLQYGNLTENNPDPDWTPIVHRNISLDNIWLTKQLEGGHFPSYPRAVHGDFGIGGC